MLSSGGGCGCGIVVDRFGISLPVEACCCCCVSDSVVHGFVCSGQQSRKDLKQYNVTLEDDAKRDKLHPWICMSLLLLHSEAFVKPPFGTLEMYTIHKLL